MREKQYINNKEFLVELKKLDATGIISEKLHMKFYKLASNYATVKSFRGYTFIDDMIVEGYLRCVRYAKSFDTKNRDNPFAYFTTAIHNVFLNHIKRESKQQDRKWMEMKILYEKYMLENNIKLNLPKDIMDKMFKEYK